MGEAEPCLDLLVHVVWIHEELELPALTHHPLKRAPYVPLSIVAVADNNALLKIIVVFQVALYMLLDPGKVRVDKLALADKSVPFPFAFLLYTFSQLDAMQLVRLLFSALFPGSFVILLGRVFAVYPGDVESIAFNVERIRLCEIFIRLHVNCKHGFFILAVSLSCVPYEHSHLLVADGHWGKDFDRLFHDPVDRPCCQLDNTELKVGCVPAVTLKPQLPVQRVEGLLSRLLHQPSFIGQGTKNALNRTYILALHLVSLCLVRFSEFIIDSLKSKGNNGDNGV